MTPSSLLVVKPSSLGDIVHTLPAVHFLKLTFPQSKNFLDRERGMGTSSGGKCRPQTVILFPRKEFRGPVGLLKFAPMVPRALRAAT